jgi:hypothetical protein
METEDYHCDHNNHPLNLTLCEMNWFLFYFSIYVWIFISALCSYIEFQKLLQERTKQLKKRY